MFLIAMFSSRSTLFAPNPICFQHHPAPLQDNDEHNLNITPKERLVRKKEVERNRRELELQLANIGFHKERQEVQKR